MASFFVSWMYWWCQEACECEEMPGELVSLFKFNTLGSDIFGILLAGCSADVFPPPGGAVKRFVECDGLIHHGLHLGDLGCVFSSDEAAIDKVELANESLFEDVLVEEFGDFLTGQDCHL